MERPPGRNPRAPATPSADRPRCVIAPCRASKCLKMLKTTRASYWLELASIWDRRYVRLGSAPPRLRRRNDGELPWKWEQSEPSRSPSRVTSFWASPKVVGEAFVVGFAGLERVLAGRVPLPEPLLAHFIGDVEEMQFVGCVGLLENRAHPASGLDPVGRKVQCHRHADSEQRNHMRPHHIAQATRISGVVVEGLQLGMKKVGVPVILADEDRRGSGRQATGERGLPGSYLAAKEGTWWVWSEAWLFTLVSRRALRPPRRRG